MATSVSIRASAYAAVQSDRRGPASVPHLNGTRMSESGRALRLAELLSSRYTLPSCDLTVIWEQPDAAVYRADEALIVRVSAIATRPLERVRGDADVLRFVEEHGIPAERLVLTADGATTAEFEGLGVLVTHYVRGVAATREISTLRTLGETLGKIRALPPTITRRAGSLPVEDLASRYAVLSSCSPAVASSAMSSRADVGHQADAPTPGRSPGSSKRTPGTQKPV